MASMGLKYLGWAKQLTEPTAAIPTYDAGKNIGKMISADVKFNTAEGELYADDKLAEWAKEVSSVDVTVECDDLSMADQGAILGATYTAATTTDPAKLQFGTGNTQPYGGLDFYQVIMVGGVKKYRVYHFLKVRASVPDETMNTRGSSISFAGKKITFRALAPNYGDLFVVTEHEDESSAVAQIKSYLNIT